MNAEERRDSVISQVLELGGVIMSVTPMATVDNPSVIATYHIQAGATDGNILARLLELKDETLFMPRSEFIPWEGDHAIVGD